MTALVETGLRTAADALRVAHAFADRLRADAARRERQRTLPHAEVAELAASGLLGITVPKEYAGPGLPPSVLADVIRIIAAADANVAQIPQSHFVFLNLVRLSGTEAQKERWFEQVLRGRLLANAQAERHGTTAAELATTLTPEPDGSLRLDGEKYYCTGTLYADLIPVLARLTRTVPGVPAGDYLAFVPVTADGIAIRDDWDVVGQRLTASGTVTLDGVRVTRDDLVPRGVVFERDQAFGAYAQLLHAAIEVGIARGALEVAADFVRTKARPWTDAKVDRATDDPLIVHRFGELTVELAQAEALLERAGRLVDAVAVQPGEQAGEQAALAVATTKVVAERSALAISSALFEVGGTRAAAGPTALDRFWRNSRVHTLHDPSRWKLQHLGRHTLTGHLPPASGQF